LTKIGKFKPGVLQRVGGADWPLLKEVVDRLRDIHLTYRSALNPSGTAPRSQAHALMMGTAKLAAYAAIGAGSGLLGGQVHIPINPIISAATGILVPTLGAHLWFTPKYLKFWVEGLNINPHARNAALLFNRWGSKVAAAYAVDQMRGANEDEVLPTIPPPRSRVPQGDVLSTIPPPRRR
jgi:hypothetical protein